MPINCPLNNLLVTLENKFYDRVEYPGGIVLYKDTGFHPEESAMLEFTVVSVPRGIQRRYDYAGMSQPIRPGDKILGRYDIVFAYLDQPDRDTPRHKNVLSYNNVEYWRVDLQKVFGIFRPNGMEMINGYVYGEPIRQENPYRGSLILPESVRLTEPTDTMRVKYIGAPLGGSPSLSVAPGDLVYTIPGVAQRYEINLQPFYIIKQSHILAVGKNVA